jgi:CheY-like chemotaxis protein/tetratricopeptide (TPR) repeat protein
MYLTTELKALRNQSRDLPVAERAQICCRLAKQFEKAGHYQEASDALSEFWPEPEGPPKVEGLDEPTRACVLLRIGALAGWLGSANQTGGSQETAKNLITESLEIFSRRGGSSELAEAHGDLALCYWREGAFDEARIHLTDALGRLSDQETDLKAVILIRSGMVEVTAGRFNEALRFYEDAAHLVEGSKDHALKGSFHNGIGTLLNDMGIAEKREDYIDRALIDYAAASFHFEQTGHTPYQASVENNLGFLFFTLGKFAKAHEHLGRAGRLFIEINDEVHLAQVNETRARTFLAEGKFVDADRLARSAVKTLEKGGEQALLCEALTTYGIVVARLGNYSRSRVLLERAIGVAETAGDPEGAGRARLSVIEDLSEHISAKELVSVYNSAAQVLERSQDALTSKRLFSCAGKVIDALAASGDDTRKPTEHSWEGFSFKQQVLNCEKSLIERALRDAGGSVTRAARLLGFNHHQSLIALINSRHKDLLKTRSTVRKRRRHLFSEPRKIKKKIVTDIPKPSALQISILHVEDNKVVTRLIQDTLAPEGMRVDSCIDGTTALEVLRGKAPYDVIIVDNDLPGFSGLELILRVRSMAHRRHTPIIMLSGADCEREAWRAGVKAFLRKPEDIEKVSLTIARLLEERKERND